MNSAKVFAVVVWCLIVVQFLYGCGTVYNPCDNPRNMQCMSAAEIQSELEN